MLKILTIALFAFCTTLASAQEVPSQPKETQYFELNCDDLGDEASADEFECVIEQPLESEPLDEVAQEVKISITGNITEKLFELPNGTSVPLSQLMVGDPDPKCIDTDISIINVTDFPPGLILFNNRTHSFIDGVVMIGGSVISVNEEWIQPIEIFPFPADSPNSPTQDIKQSVLTR